MEGVESALNEILERLSNLEKKERDQVAILWDLENINPGSKSLFTDGLREFASNYGNVTISKVFADFTLKNIAPMTETLAIQGFSMINVHAFSRYKNSSDLELVTHGMEIAITKPEIKTFILLSGDSDFAPLITALRRSNKRVVIVYDSKRVNDKLLSLADEIVDYRKLVPGDDDEEEDTDETMEETTTESRIKNSFSTLVRAVEILSEEGKETSLGLVKIRMKILKPSFDETELGFSQFSRYIEKAEAQGVIKVEGKKFGGGTIKIVNGKSIDVSIPHKELLKVLKALDQSKKPQYHLFSHVQNILKSKFSYRSNGYQKFKDYILDLESAGIVETQVDGLAHSIKRIE